MAIPIAFSRNGRVEGRHSGIGWALFKNCFKYSNKSGEFIVCKVRHVRRRNYAGIDTGEQSMNMMMLRRTAMRAGVVALCSAALCAVPMMAQGGGGGGRGGMAPDAQVAALDTAVTLTADQKTAALKIYTDGAAKITALRAATPPDPDMMTKVQAIRTDENTAIKALLTPDQQTKFAAMPQGRGGRRGGGGGAPGGGAPPAPPQ
jgi:protein CpxP